MLSFVARHGDLGPHLNQDRAALGEAIKEWAKAANYPALSAEWAASQLDALISALMPHPDSPEAGLSHADRMQGLMLRGLPRSAEKRDEFLRDLIEGVEY